MIIVLSCKLVSCRTSSFWSTMSTSLWSSTSASSRPLPQPFVRPPSLVLNLHLCCPAQPRYRPSPHPSQHLGLSPRLSLMPPPWSSSRPLPRPCPWLSPQPPQPRQRLSRSSSYQHHVGLPQLNSASLVHNYIGTSMLEKKLKYKLCNFKNK